MPNTRHLSHHNLTRRMLLGATLALSALALPALAQTKTVLRISTPAVPDDWHAKTWTVFKDTLEKTAPGEFDVQINLSASLFKQGAEPAAMARGNLELSTLSPADIAEVLHLYGGLHSARPGPAAKSFQLPHWC
jgi:TRAP-type C4-dicarboxylate transport system substrate-binding protein